MKAEQQAELERQAVRIRRRFLQMHHAAKSGHIGTGLSAIDILVYLYKSWLRPEDAFILSKGHGASALYVTLHDAGLISDAHIASYYQDGTLLPAHPAARALGPIPAATGSLGHGLPIANGMAYARKVLDGGSGRVACLLSDGECNEGSTWEAILFAAHHRLSNLVAIVDANGLQGFGRTEDVLRLEPFAEKWKAFGFDVVEINGHDFAALDGVLTRAPSESPLCIIARTIKGKGVSFLEDTLASHYLPINDAQLAQALAELDAAESRLASHAR
jgi:transketolase